ncbi:MAG: PHP domain-containing protein [Verrucomicrobiota bacterium]
MKFTEKAQLLRSLLGHSLDEFLQVCKDFPHGHPDKKKEGHSWYDLHGHTNRSDGILGPIGKMLFAIYATELDGLAFTDHNNMDAYDVANNFLHSRACKKLFERKPNPKPHFKILRGIEVSSENDVHILGIGIDRGEIPRGMSWKETTDRIHQLNGLALAPHPFASFPGIEDFRGVGYGFLDPQYGFDGVETRNASLINIFYNAFVAKLNRESEHPLAEYGGSDSHWPGSEGFCCTGFPGKGFTDLKKAFAENKTYAVGHVESVFDFALGPLRYYRFYNEVKDIAEFKNLLRNPMEMYEPVFEFLYRNLQREVQYRFHGRKVPTKSRFFPPKPEDFENGIILNSQDKPYEKNK